LEVVMTERKTWLRKMTNIFVKERWPHYDAYGNKIGWSTETTGILGRFLRALTRRTRGILRTNLIFRVARLLARLRS
jgi:hypothetical protein